MNTQIMDQLFSETYMMMNIEITFAGVRRWFEMAEIPIDDATLFNALLFPERISEIFKTEMSLIIIYRHEDMFFQNNRMDSVIDTIDPLHDVRDPINQLLLKLMNTRLLHGCEDALIDMGVTLKKDMSSANPLYPSLHGFITQ